MGKKVWVDLTHPFSAEIPRWPYFDKPVIDSKHSMAKGGVLTQYIGCTMHTGTHCDAPRHVMEREFDGRRARYTHEMAIDAYTGDAVCLDLHFMKRWELTDNSDLQTLQAPLLRGHSARLSDTVPALYSGAEMQL